MIEDEALSQSTPNDDSSEQEETPVHEDVAHDDSAEMSEPESSQPEEHSVSEPKQEDPVEEETTAESTENEPAEELDRETDAVEEEEQSPEESEEIAQDVAEESVDSSETVDVPTETAETESEPVDETTSEPIESEMQEEDEPEPVAVGETSADEDDFEETADVEEDEESEEPETESEVAESDSEEEQDESSDEDKETTDEPVEDNKDWYVVKVQSGREETIRAAIERRVKIEGLEPFYDRIVIPTEKETVLQRGKRVTREKKKFPGYFMAKVEFNDEILYLFRETSGVGDFVGGAPGQPPIPMSSTEVKRMIGGDAEEPGAEPSKGDKDMPILDFGVGDRVKIKDGVFSGMEGEVAEILAAKEQVRVMLEVLGRPVSHELEYWQVEPV